LDSSFSKTYPEFLLEHISENLTKEAPCTTFQRIKEHVMTTLTIRLPDGMKSELDEISREEHKAVSDIAREALQRYLAVTKFRLIRKKVLPFAEAQGLLTDEDVFKALR
jgi:predicted transcriptional regulator